MRSELTDLVRDAGSLSQFIGSIYRRRDESYATHRTATTDFLDYVRKLGDHTKTFLQRSIEQARDFGDPALAPYERQRLTTIRNFWSNLHPFVRPIENAHTLCMPVAFIEFLEHILSGIPRLKGCDVVISHTPELNYFFHRRTNLRQDSKRYEAIVEGSPAFPPKSALIGIPYSQGTSLFVNLIICHELGHFAFEELGLAERLTNEIDDVLQQLPNYNVLSEPDLSWCRERLKYWSEEIYCDRFALGLIGPAFSFAYIELFDLIGMSNTKAVEFSDTHPADACRFKEHAAQLQTCGWMPLLRKAQRTNYVGLIDRLAQLDEAQYVFESTEMTDLANPVLQIFLQLKPRIEAFVNDTLQSSLRRFNGSTDNTDIRLVTKYLTNGVVPSTTMYRKKPRYPDPVALINAAYLFYLESLGDLIGRIEGQNENDLSHRTRWAERVEMWTLKALEDLILLSNNGEAHIGGSFEGSNT